MGNMLTGHLYLSSDFSGGVFDEAHRSLDERREEENYGCLVVIVDGLCVENNIRFYLGLSRINPSASI
jgi:hypothetical protein